MRIPNQSRGVNAGYHPHRVSLAGIKSSARVRIGSGGAPMAMCCGSVDPDTMTGDNCARVPSGHNCAGDILACDPGCAEVINIGGKGWCDCPPAESAYGGPQFVTTRLVQRSF